MACEFYVAVVARPLHLMKVKVLKEITATPVAEALVRWGAFRTATDAHGQAELKLPKGAHELMVWKAGFEVPLDSVAIDGDIAVVIAVASVEEEDPDAAWKM